MYGGFVRWEAGTKADGSDSRAIPIAKEDHWTDLQLLILVASAEKKKVSSTTGMQTSVATSDLLGHRASSVVPGRLAAMEEAYKKRDFETFGKITMQDSNQFHATCLDTYPPIFYLNEVSHRIINLVHAFNDFHGAVKAAYTFDAGPNAVVFMEKANIAQFLALARHIFPTEDQSYINDAVLRTASDKVSLPTGLVDAAEKWVGVQRQGLITRIMHTTVGQGPRELPKERALLDPKTGYPTPSGTSGAAGPRSWHQSAAMVALCGAIGVGVIRHLMK
jgi:diphosphomevalonate decarboxylase